MTTIKNTLPPTGGCSAVRDLIFENINDKYAWGNYGEFKVLMMRENGYINVTKLCKEGGKEMSEWNRSKHSIEMLKSFSSDLGLQMSGLLITINGGNQTLLTRGTYAHPDLVPHIASWVSPSFAIKVSGIINKWRALSHENELEYWNSMGECFQSQEKKLCIEHIIRDRLAEQLQGKIEVETAFGRADVVTDNEVIEIKRLCNWKHALGQVLAYTSDPFLSDRKMRIHLFDETQASPLDINSIEKVCSKYGCSVTFECVS
jgi:hypothetical protein